MSKPKSPREIMMQAISEAISGPIRFHTVLEGYAIIVQEIEYELAANGWEIVRKKPALVEREKST